MEPNSLNNQEQPQIPPQPQPQTPPPAETPSAPINQPMRPPMTMPTSKKSQKKLYIIIGVVVAVIIIAVIGYFVLAHKKTVTPADSGKNGSTMASNATDNSTVGLITSVLTNSASSETKVTNTDESNLSSDANNIASSLGDSVNENSIK
ncbi:MAG TPA: hypothetical protein VMR16_00240 [Candidatus Saccharimonadales bacterium]|nr:hypothetical protein [Candidatus Saccharimonadales bacterium]